MGGCPLINTAVEADDNYPELRARVVRTIGIIQHAIEKITYRGISEGQIKNDFKVDEFATAFFATIEGAIIISRLQGDQRSYQLIAKTLHKQVESITI